MNPEQPPFTIKICGVTRAADAQAAVATGADAIGLNFCALSPRRVRDEDAAAIARSVAGRALRVGVFVNADASEVFARSRQVGLDLVQLHGDEPPETVASLDPLPVMRAFRLEGSDVGSVVAYLERCSRLGASLAAVLLDAYHPAAYGGTGQVGSWAAAAAYRGLADQRGGLPPLVLAGGLTAANVAEAVALVRPAAIDVASGVESEPGRKSPEKMLALVRAAREALVQSGSRGPDRQRG